MPAIRVLHRIRQLFDNRRFPIILAFHRIAEPASDPWGLSVAPSRFEEQMLTLKARRVPLSMSDFVSALEDGTLPVLAVAVTFDDGYVDNLRVAKPILERVGIPATVFLTTGYLGKQKEFWWDELARLILVRRQAVAGTVNIGGRSLAVQIPALPAHRDARSTWRAWEPPRTARERLYFEIWSALHVLEPAARKQGVESVRQLFGHDAADAGDFPMTREDVRHLVTGAGIEIGAHSETHQPLTALGPAERRHEIERSRVVCEALMGRPVEGFAYPHGDRDKLTTDLVRECGFRWACSIEPAAIDGHRFDRFDLPRVQARNWTAPELERVLNRTRTPAA